MCISGIFPSSKPAPNPFLLCINRLVFDTFHTIYIYIFRYFQSQLSKETEEVLDNSENLENDEALENNEDEDSLNENKKQVCCFMQGKKY